VNKRTSVFIFDRYTRSRYLIRYVNTYLVDLLNIKLKR